MIKLTSKWLALIGLAFFLSSCSKKEPELLKIQGKTMGTYYHITYVLDGDLSENKALSTETLQSQIDKRLELVNDQMSTYRPDSELSRFNQAEKSLTVSDATRRVVEASLELFKQSNGAFDVTVGPLVNLWGFGPDKRPEKVPAQSLIEQKNQVVGSQHLSVSGNILNKDIPELYVDLSSIAKGYGVDDIAQYLQSLGINNYLVDIGGELRVNGMKPGNEDWTLAIERPSAGQNVQRLINIGDNAIATSGDYRNYYEFDGIRYSHTIDPTTGKPINHKLVSVTVIHPSSMYADGLATVITVLGPEKGLAFAKQHQLAVFLLVKNGDDFIESYTPEFEPYFIEEK
ncbi:FAD:protein FMN transferase [Psychromonas aquimarina]|uniref:FAD:protein FMN transferase n=1 Tax=Psychromonas aquimarina TaxID=444919 RepID=UPI0004013A31|nr:FAD:protein FMN transferase [Psychromonas aquimarina]